MPSDLFHVESRWQVVWALLFATIALQPIPDESTPLAVLLLAGLAAFAVAIAAWNVVAELRHRGESSA